MTWCPKGAFPTRPDSFRQVHVRNGQAHPARHALALAKHDAAFFGGVRMRRTRTLPEIDWESWPATDVNGDFFWLAVLRRSLLAVRLFNLSLDSVTLSQRSSKC